MIWIGNCYLICFSPTWRELASRAKFFWVQLPGAFDELASDLQYLIYQSPCSRASIYLPPYIPSVQLPRLFRFCCDSFSLDGPLVKMPVALRTIAPFLRASRHCLRPGSAANPLDFAGRLNLTRSYAVFERTKPHVNIGTIGHVDHGKVRMRKTPTPGFGMPTSVVVLTLATIDHSIRRYHQETVREGAGQLLRIRLN